MKRSDIGDITMFDNLIGAKLIDFDENGFKVLINDSYVKTFEFDSEKGDCCSYNNILSNLLIDKEELKKNPVVTDVAMYKYCGNRDQCSSFNITLFGEFKPIAEIHAESSSGSGFRYGATVTCRCKETNEEEIITEW